jgi:hypothetical protein
MMGPVPRRKVRKEHLGLESHRPVDRISDPHIIEIHCPDRRLLAKQSRLQSLLVHGQLPFRVGLGRGFRDQGFPGLRSRVRMAIVAAGELSRYGGDRGDDSREARELAHQAQPRDFATGSLTQRDIEFHNKRFRGELRWEGDRWVESEPYADVQREDRARRMRDEVKLPGRARELPDARDAMPNLSAAEIDGRKFFDYSMNPEHPANGGKAKGWRDLGYQVDNLDARQEAAADLRELIKHHLLWDGKVAEVRESAYGRHYKVLNGFIGPNDRHATLVTCWRVAGHGESGYPQLMTTWAQPHRDRGRDR